MTHPGLTNCTPTQEKCIWENEKRNENGAKRQRERERDVERCFIFMRPASEIAALALESTIASITITKEIAHCSASRYPVKGLHVLNG